jgi:hypothetical protein
VQGPAAAAGILGPEEGPRGFDHVCHLFCWGVKLLARDAC